jgi:hypothetical protein
MKRRAHLRNRQPGKQHFSRRRAAITRGHDWPAPDPSTRVELDLVVDRPLRRHEGEFVVATGLGAILVSVSSAFVKLLDLPKLSEVSVAALGGALVLIGFLLRYDSKPAPSNSTTPAPTPPIAQPQPEAVDLPSMTGQLSGILAELRQQYGMAYRTRTWIDDVLPEFGPEFDDPTLARDLLAVAALDAGGIRADVTGLVRTHSPEEIIATGRALLQALKNVLAACEGSIDQPAVRPSDPSRWPVVVAESF